MQPANNVKQFISQDSNLLISDKLTIGKYEINFPTLERLKERRWLEDDNINGFLSHYTNENDNVLVYKKQFFSLY